MAIVVRNEGAKVNSNINVTPMVDVMLVLLIIFMVITPMLQNKVNVELAKVTDPTTMPDADKEDAVIVAVTRETRYIWDRTRSRWPISGVRSPICSRTRRKNKSLCGQTPGRSTGRSWMRLMMFAPPASIR